MKLLNFFLLSVFTLLFSVYGLAGNASPLTKKQNASIELAHSPQKQVVSPSPKPLLIKKLEDTMNKILRTEDGKVNIFALIGGILGLCSLIGLFIPFIGWLIPLSALVLGVIGLIQIKKNGERGKGWAWTGILAGVGYLLLVFLLVLLYILLGIGGGLGWF